MKLLPELSAEMQALFQRAEAGDKSALPALRQALDERPDIWQLYGDLGWLAESSWRGKIAGPNLLMAESISLKLQQMRQELLEAGDSPLERLLVQRVLLCWLQVCHADAMVAQHTSPTPNLHTMLEKRQSGAQSRFSKAVQALATTRKLLRPAVSPLEMLGGTKGNGRRDVLRRDTLPTGGVAVTN